MTSPWVWSQRSLGNNFAHKNTWQIWKALSQTGGLHSLKHTTDYVYPLCTMMSMCLCVYTNIHRHAWNIQSMVSCTGPLFSQQTHTYQEHGWNSPVQPVHTFYSIHSRGSLPGYLYPRRYLCSCQEYMERSTNLKKWKLFNKSSIKKKLSTWNY